MKKIVSVLAISALALGSVFAEISLSFTQRSYVSKKTGKQVVKFDLDGDDELSGAGDCVTFEFSNEVAGVVLDFDPIATAKSLPGLHEYYGWVNVLDGALTFQSGVWDTVNTHELDDDGGYWDDAQYAKYGLGVRDGIIAQNIANLTAFVLEDDADDLVADPGLAFAATYNNTDLGLFVTAAAIRNANGYVGNGEKSKDDCYAGFALEAGFSLPDLLNLNLIVKNQAKETFAVGLFAELVAVKNFDVLFGASFGTASKKSLISKSYVGADGNPVEGRIDDDTGEVLSYQSSAYNELGFDLRARWQITNRVALTTMNNVSYTKWSEADEGVLSVWDMLSVSAKANDTIRLTATAEWDYADISQNGIGELSLIPGIEISVAEEARFTTGFIANFDGFGSGVDNVGAKSFAIPFIFHVGL